MNNDTSTSASSTSFKDFRPLTNQNKLELHLDPYISENVETQQQQQQVNENLNSNMNINKININDESLITKLDTNNIDRNLKNGGGVWLLKFYAPWCKHSQEFQKTFVELSHLLKDHLSFGSVDCINDPMLLHRFEITAYPTLKLLYNGMLYEFQGERTIDNIVQFLQSGYKDSTAMAYPLIDQEEILKRQLELQYSREGLSADQVAQLEKQIKEKQQEFENKKLARKHLEVEHDHNEEQEINEYNERINRKVNNNHIQDVDAAATDNNAATGTPSIEEHQHNQLQGNSTSVISSTGSMLSSLLDSKLAYLLFGSISTGLFFIIKKKITKKSKFMKIA